MSDIHESVFLAEGCRIIGEVSIGEQSSVWYNAVLRGDQGVIRIGKGTNIQDNAVLHTGPGLSVEVGDNVTIGHGAIVHGCKVGSNTLIGMGSIIMNRCVIGGNCIIGAGSLVIGGTVIPDGSLVMGSPAKVVKQVSEAQIRYIEENSSRYVKLAAKYIEDGMSV